MIQQRIDFPATTYHLNDKETKKRIESANPLQFNRNVYDFGGFL